MAQDAYSVFGNVYLDPTSASSGGTLLRGLDTTRPIRLIPPPGVRTERFGGRADAVRNYRWASGEPWQLVLPAIGGNTALVKLFLQSYTEDGLTAVSSGVGSLANGAGGRSFEAVVRPLDPNEDGWFFPRLQLFEDTDIEMNRSRVELTQFDESLLVMLVSGSETADVAAATIGDESTIDAAIEAATGEEMAYIRKIVTVAELVAIGAATSGRVAMSDALPAGSVPIAFYARNRGTAFTSSAGSVTQLDCSIVASGQTADAFADGEVGSLMTAGIRGGKPLTNAGVASSIAPWPNGAWTPQVYVECNRNLSTLTSGTDGIEIIILYQPVTLPT